MRGAAHVGGRSPSWGAWIEMLMYTGAPSSLSVAPPRGERGLKFTFDRPLKNKEQSLPLVGSVD